MLQTLFPHQKIWPYISGREKAKPLFYTKCLNTHNSTHTWHTNKSQHIAAIKNVHCTVFWNRNIHWHTCIKQMYTKHIYTHTHIDGTSLWPDRNYDGCVIISSTPPVSNKLLLLFPLFSPSVKLLISAASRGDGKSLHRDERSSTNNTKPSLFYFHTQKQSSSVLSSLALRSLQSPCANSPLSNYLSPYKLQLLKKKHTKKTLLVFVLLKRQQTDTLLEKKCFHLCLRARRCKFIFPSLFNTNPENEQ